MVSKAEIDKESQDISKFNLSLYFLVIQPQLDPLYSRKSPFQNLKKCIIILVVVSKSYIREMSSLPVPSPIYSFWARVSYHLMVTEPKIFSKKIKNMLINKY